MSATATFHARRLTRPVAGRARAFGGVGEKDLTFVVTTEGKVYERNTGLFSRLAEYELEYDAKTKTTGSVIDIDVKDDAARRLEATIESSYVTLDEAKNRADEVLAMKGEKPVPAAPSPASPSPAPEAAPPAAAAEGGPPAAGGGKSDIPWGYIAAGVGGVVVVGGIIYFATRK
jgi:hypothetical protein